MSIGGHDDNMGVIRHEHIREQQETVTLAIRKELLNGDLSQTADKQEPRISNAC